jgi:hypothetical protein
MIFLLFVVFSFLSYKLWKINKETSFLSNHSVKLFSSLVIYCEPKHYKQMHRLVYAIYITLKIKTFFCYRKFETLLSKKCTDLFNRFCYRNTVIKTNSQTNLTKQNTAKQQPNVLNSSIHKQLQTLLSKNSRTCFRNLTHQIHRLVYCYRNLAHQKNKYSNSCVNCKIHSSLQIHRDWDSVRDPWNRGHGQVCNFTNKLL